MRMKPWRHTILLIISLFSLSACSSLSFYGQAIKGQVQVLSARQDIDQVIADKDSPPELVAQLKQAKAIRRFAAERLGMPDNGSYTQYADLQRPYVVWNVVAAPANSLEPLQHCFPFAGCVVYRGFFKEAAAQVYADRLHAQGYETYRYGVRAYSTLGWFDDPILNTMLNTRDEWYLASLIFHELTHQVIYIKGDSSFNESFATAIEQLAIEQWLQAHGNHDLRTAYQRRQRMERQFLELVMSYRNRLQALYEDGGEYHQHKTAIYLQLREAYERMKLHQWQGYSGYDHWFSNQLNNAKLAVVAAYHDQVDVVFKHYRQCGLSLPQYLDKLSNNIKKSKHIEALQRGDLALCK